MKTKLLILLFFLVLNSNTDCFSQGHSCKQDLFPARSENKMYGYVDITGTWKVRPVFDQVFPFRGNVALIRKGPLYGVITCDGEVVVPVQYEEIKEYIGGYAWVKKNGLYGLINEKGKFIISPSITEYIDINKYETFSWVCNDKDQWGLYSKFDEKFIFEYQFESVKFLNRFFSLVKSNDLIGVIDQEKGVFVQDLKFYEIRKISHRTMAVRDSLNHWGIMNDFGVMNIECQYSSIELMDQNLYKVSFDQKFGIINKDGSVILPVEYEFIGNLSNSRIRVIKDSKTGYFLRNGQKMSLLKYDEGSDFSKGSAIVKKGNDSFLINKSDSVLLSGSSISKFDDLNIIVLEKENVFSFYNEEGIRLSSRSFDYVQDLVSKSNIIVKKQNQYLLFDLSTDSFLNNESFDSIFFIGYESFKVSKDGFWNIMNNKGQVLSNQNFDSILVKNHYYHCYKNKNIILYDQNIKLISLPIVLDVEPVSINSFWIKEKKKWGIYSSKTNAYTVKPYYSAIGESNINTHVVYKKNKCGLILNNNKVVIDFEYDSIFYLTDQYWKTKNENLYGIVNTKSNDVVVPAFDQILGLSEGYFLVQKGGMFGYINKKGEEKMKVQFIEAHLFNDEIALVKCKDRLYYIIDKRGKNLTEGFEEYEITSNEIILKKKNLNLIVKSKEEMIKRRF